MASRPAAGSALWSGPMGPHYVENVGQGDLHILAVEIKAAQSAAAPLVILKVGHLMPEADAATSMPPYLNQPMTNRRKQHADSQG
jgi:hypothetical protein